MLSSGVRALVDVVKGAAGTPEIVACVLYAMPLTVFQVVLPFLPYRQWDSMRRVSLFLLFASATYLAVIIAGANWNGLIGPLAGSAVLLLTGFRAWAAFALVVADAPVRAAVEGSSMVSSIGPALTAALCGLVVLGLARLTQLVCESWASQAETAHRAVSRERRRFAMDLHDLLGYSLSSIALKSELIYQLVPSRPEQARKEIDEVLEISRQALSDVRLVARRYRGMSLESEVSSVESVLNSLGVVAHVDIRCGSLPPAVDTALATAVREGVTNALRHAHVRHVTIRAIGEQEQVRLVVANDGLVGGVPGQPCPGGNGLHNLASRFDDIGGHVDAGATDDGWFHLVCEAPRGVALESVRPAS
ncbi:sensor histidine kinase [Streptomyces griseofuscus]|uniref:sensor histidine kinase n=1 Tax=Streptomyces griseofuscus TaxID=146922 RepID=UPI0038120F90